MVQSVFRGVVQVKQDPVHVMMRIKEKIASTTKKKHVSKELMGAMYTVDRKLCPPQEMEEKFRDVTGAVTARDMSCSEAIWHGCVESNATQIRNGDLFVGTNDYTEAHTTMRIASTSQLEGFHSGLKTRLNRTVAAAVSLRILDIFIVQHNLKIGAKFSRNCSFGDFDFVSLVHTAMLSQGTLHESPHLEFITHVLVDPLPKPWISQWLRVFGSARVAPDNIEADLGGTGRQFVSFYI
ncbi:hypothetical protein GN958_ATG08980 [Phytophthora infestans]|nr:hypothetical protein GN958_ATG08980 [Phytophthora infestans]